MKCQSWPRPASFFFFFTERSSLKKIPPFFSPKSYIVPVSEEYVMLFSGFQSQELVGHPFYKTTCNECHLVLFDHRMDKEACDD